VLDGNLDIPKVVLLKQRALPQRAFDQRLRSGLAVLLQQPLVQRAGIHADPDRHVRRGCRPRDFGDLVVELPDVARVDRTAAQPASIAANTYFGWKWMSAITGICDFFAIAGNASTSSWTARPPGRSGSRSPSARRSVAASR